MCGCIDFSRVRRLLLGLEDVEKRSAEVYVQGHWEKGGYLRGELVRLETRLSTDCEQMPRGHLYLRPAR